MVACCSMLLSSNPQPSRDATWQLQTPLLMPVSNVHSPHPRGSPIAPPTHSCPLQLLLPRQPGVKVAAAAEPPRSNPSPSSAARLVPRVENVDGYWIVKEDCREGLNVVEKMKLRKDPTKFLLEGGLAELASVPFAELDGSSKEAKEDIDMRLKWLGLFHRRKHQYGRFMVRFKLPNGVTTSAQMRLLADVIKQYGADGCADVTTRQNWQIRGVQLKDAPQILAALEEVGLPSIQSGMDNVRNVVGNPLAGIDPHEIVDTTPYCQQLNAYVTARGKGNPDVTNLPRKWNVCVVGSHDLFEHPHINDLAFVPAAAEQDPLASGFNLLVGGFFSPRRCAEAVPLGAWVAERDVAGACQAVLETYRDLGTRGDRQRTRMMWLIDELGVEVFRAEVAKRMPAGSVFLPASSRCLVDESWARREYLGVHSQRQEGLFWVGLHVPVGRLQADDMHELARLAEAYGTGELRLTVEQNVILPNVPKSMVESLLREPLLQRFSPSPGPLLGSLVACTGSQFCGQAIIETKHRALQLTRELEDTMVLPATVRMHWTGCPNTCAQVQVADIGFMGCMTRGKDNKPCEGVHIFVGGRVGSASHLGEKYMEAVPCEDLLPVVQELLITLFGASKKAPC